MNKDDQSEREAFEKWQRDEDHMESWQLYRHPENGRYVNSTVQAEWRAWQARAAAGKAEEREPDALERILKRAEKIDWTPHDPWAEVRAVAGELERYAENPDVIRELAARLRAVGGGA